MGFLLRWLDCLRHRARSRTWTLQAASGRRGEDLAHRFLRGEGLIVVARNFRSRSGSGEIDMVAWEGETLVFVEVKSRRSEEFGSPDRAVDRDKRETLVHTAREYARRANIPWQRIRFDIVNVVLRNPPALSHLRDAFSPGKAL